MFKNGIKRVYKPSFVVKGLLSKDEITQITESMKSCVKAFLNGTRGMGKFSFGDVFGGYNNPWEEPFVKVYNIYYYRTNNEQKAKQKAALDLGKLLKIILKENESYDFSVEKVYRKGKEVNYYNLVNKN